MKKILVLLLALLLAVPAAFAAKTNCIGNVVIDDDVKGFVITACHWIPALRLLPSACIGW